MNSIYAAYKNALFWNIQSALVYKFLLITHQSALFSIAPAYIFGHAGTLFASLFFLISITNFGFDYSLISLFSKHTQKNRISSIHFLMYKIISSCLVGYTLWYLYNFVHVSYLTFLFQDLSPFLIASYITLYITENTKKTLALFADLSFQNKQHFFIEIGCLFGYIATVWSFYFCTSEIDIQTLLVPFSAWSFIECLLLFWYVQKIINSENLKTQTFLLPIDQPLNYINQLLKTLYSSNSLFMMISWQYGFAKVGTIKLVLDVLSFLHTFLYRTIGTPLAALYAHTKNIPGLLPALTSYSYTLGLVWLCIITAVSISHYVYFQVPHIITLFYLITISFLEYAQIPYEKILLVQNKALLVFSSYVLGIIYTAIIYFLFFYLHISIHLLFFIFISKIYSCLFIQKNAIRLANF